MQRGLGWLFALVLLAASALPASGYAVLTHEAIVDSVWLDQIQPLLKRRFPAVTPDELTKAHAYAYGGAIIQDMGYYPFGSKFFSDLVHYVRAGDFVVELVRDAQDVNEYAFALGALAHYAADNNGHPLAVNPSVAILYPKLRARYGNRVTYEDDPAAHMKVEFGFDVIQVAKGNYAPKAYHDFIGFEVSKGVLERAFQNTYGLRLAGIFTSLDLALGTYRHTVSTILPEATKIAWNLNQDEIVKSQPSITRQRFLYNLSRASYEREWGNKYERPGPFAKFLALLFRIIPKVGPFRGVQFKPATPETEKLFMNSFNQTLAHYRALLTDVGRGRLQLPNNDFDTGAPAREGEYKLADEAYAKLLRTLAQKKWACGTPEMRANILAFFADPNRPNAVRRDKRKWRDTMRALAALKQWTPVSAQSAAAPQTRLNGTPAAGASTEERDHAAH